MDDDKKIVNHFHLTDLGLGSYMVLVLIGMAFIVLIMGVKDGEIIAIVIATVISVLFLLGLGVMTTLFIMGRAHKHEERRATAEQSRFRDNTRENLSTLELQARAQLAQAKAQNEQWRTVRGEMDTMRKMLPGPDNGATVGFAFDDALFDELDVVE